MDTAPETFDVPLSAVAAEFGVDVKTVRTWCVTGLVRNWKRLRLRSEIVGGRRMTNAAAVAAFAAAYRRRENTSAMPPVRVRNRPGSNF